MRVRFAHIRARATSGGWIDYVVFEARSSSGSQADNQSLLAHLTARARASALRVDQSALAYQFGAGLQFFGTRPLVEHLSRSGLPAWTHALDA